MYKDNENLTLSFEQNIIVLNLGEICMKIKYLVFVALFMLVCVGCSEKKEETKKNQERMTVEINERFAKIDWLDSSKRIVLKDVILPFIKRQCPSSNEECPRKYDIEDLYWTVEWKCKKKKCASYIQDSRFVEERIFVLDSLYRSNVLDSLVGLIQWSQKKNQERNCFFQKSNGEQEVCPPNPDLDLGIEGVLERLKEKNVKRGGT